MNVRTLFSSAAALRPTLQFTASSFLRRQFSVSPATANVQLMSKLSDVLARNKSFANNSPIPNALQLAKPPKMGPNAGRSVVVEGDLAGAFMKLRTVLSKNKVRSDFQRQRFHERPGMKRKRLKAERHRKRFKLGFQKMVALALDMKKKGM